MSLRNLQLDYGSEPSSNAISKIYDICIMGSGTAGAIAAHKFVEEGYDVLMIEQGPFIKKEITYEDIFMQSELAYARNTMGAWSLIGYPWTSCNVGGGCMFYGGVSFRYREVDFNAATYLNQSDLPLEWPYSYDDLSPYYEKVEQLIGVSGQPNNDPYAPTDHHSLPLPPVKTSKNGAIIRDAALKLGLKPFPTPLAIATQQYNNRSACDYTSACIEHYCSSGAKADPYLVFLKDLLSKKNFTLFAGLKACYLRREKKNQIASIDTYHLVSQKEYNFKAKLFIVACSAIQSAALLLRSKDYWSPAGIGNEADMVGRGLCFKLSRYVSGYVNTSSQKNSNNFGPFSTISITDHYIDSTCPTGLGGLIYEANYGFKFKVKNDEHILRLESLLGDQPLHHNRIRLADREMHNKVPRIIIDYRAHPIDLMRLEYLTERCEGILKAAGCRLTFREESGNEVGSTHLHGTCRSGDDPKFSVLDKKSRVHSLDNLYIIDGSFMPYPGGVNPTLTIQAHSLKITTELCQQMRR